jgi:hypothetical protein
MLAPLRLSLATLALAAAAVVTTAHAGESTPEPAPSPTPFPAGATVLRARVVHDLDKDGQAEAGEPGLPAWRVQYSCGDAVQQLPFTDTAGEAAAALSPYQGSATVCPWLQRQFRWYPTTPLRLPQQQVRAGETVEVTFLVHDLGTAVMEVSGEVIVAGLPPTTANFALAAPFAACADVLFEPGAVASIARVYVSGARGRPGCPAPGDEVAIVLEGAVAAALPYDSGAEAGIAFAAHGDSMRIYAHDVDAARIGGVDCAVVVPLSGFVPPDSVRVFVLGDEVRAGCGAPGRSVRFYRDGLPLDPLVPWRAGPLVYPDAPELVPASETPILLPSVGDGATLERTVAPVGLAGAAALFVAGVLLAAASAVRPRRLGR